jgi:hypothetical protein
VSDAKAQIGFHQIGLGGVLKQYRLQVPSNQREYSWTITEVTTLLQDFAKAIADGEGEYFLGTVVTIPRSPELLEVVDGQQRLATTAILLSQIRNYLIQREPLLAESITNGFLTDIDRDRRERVAKLQLNLDDNEFFRAMIELPGLVRFWTVFHMGRRDCPVAMREPIFVGDLNSFLSSMISLIVRSWSRG